MTKSKKQRLQEINKAKDQKNLLILGATVAVVIIAVYAMAG